MNLCHMIFSWVSVIALLTKTLAPRMLSVCAMAATLTAALPVRAQNQKPIPSSKEVIELAKKAVGGPAFFDPKPHVINYTIELKGDNRPRGFYSTYTYKDKKIYEDNYLDKRSFGGGSGFMGKMLINMQTKEVWEFQSSNVSEGKWKKLEWGILQYSHYPVIPCYNLVLDNLTFQSETPAIVKEKGAEYYKLEAKLKEQQYQDWDYTFFVNANNNLLYKMDIVNKKTSFRHTKTFTNYKNFGEIAIPQKITSNNVPKEGRNYGFVLTINDFTFKNNIPDSLFVVPK